MKDLKNKPPFFQKENLKKKVSDKIAKKKLNEEKTLTKDFWML
ncbi:MAG: hypothetical protein ACI4F9_01910 [Lachnospiraceae bacterium]